MKTMKEKNIIKVKRYESPCGVLLLGSFGGTDFQKTVWNELLKIPFGKTISCGEMARRIGMSKAVRAVANANGANSMSIFVPCHRIIGSDHLLTGYGGGLLAKKFLLELESQPCLAL